MICRTKCRVGVDEEAAGFAVRVLDPGTGTGHAPQRFSARPIDFHARYASSSLVYRMTLSVRYGGSGSTSSSYKDVFGAAETAATFAAKLGRHNAEDRKEAPDVDALRPLLAWESGPIEGAKRFVLRLPAHTAVYADQTGFFQTLGFDPRALHTRLGETGRLQGAWNGADEPVALLGSSFFGPENLAPAWKLFDGTDESGKRVTVTRALEDHTLPIESDGERPAKLNSAMETLAGMLARALRGMALPEDTLALEMESEEEGMIISSKETTDSRVTLELSFAPDLARFLRVGLPALSFPLFDRRSYALNPREEEADPLRDRYPVSLVLQGAGHAVHHLQDLGFVSLLGHLDSAGGEFRGPATLLEGTDTYLSVRLVDKTLRVVRFKDPLDLYLTLEIHPLVVVP